MPLLPRIGCLLFCLAAAELRAAAADWTDYGLSIEGRTLRMTQVGGGSRRMLVVGPLHGDEPGAAAFVERLALWIAARPTLLRETHLTLVPVPNPDGQAQATRENARGVELDLNFPTAGWRGVQAGERSLAGTVAASEPETRALCELLARVQPQRLLLIRQTGGAQPRLYAAGLDLGRVAQLGRAAGAAVRPLSGAEPGSLSTLMALERRVPTTIVELPALATTAESWARLGAVCAIALDADAEALAAWESDAALPGSVRAAFGLETAVPPRSSSTVFTSTPTRRDEPAPNSAAATVEPRPLAPVHWPAASAVPPRPAVEMPASRLPLTTLPGPAWPTSAAAPAGRLPAWPPGMPGRVPQTPIPLPAAAWPAR